MKVILKDGSSLEVEKGISVLDLAKKISEGLARVATCGEIDGKIYEFNKEGVLVKELIPGWLLEGGTYYWINGDGSKAVGWKQIGAYWYWFAEDGKMLTGWQ